MMRERGGGTPAGNQANNELILRAAGEGIYGLDREGLVTFANPAAIEMLGSSAEALIGRSMHNLHHHTRSDGSPYPGVECPIYAASKDGEVHCLDNEVFWRSDGTRFPVEYTSTPILDGGTPIGAVVVFRDITKRKLIEQALKESERRYRSLYENTPVMMHSIDHDGRLLSVSNHWLAALGYTREEVIGRPTVDFLSERSRRQALELDLPRFMSTGSVQNIEYEMVKKSGELVDVLLSAVTERDAAGEMTRSIAVIVDVTERKSAEARVRELQADLHHVSRLSAMGEMASGLAHELNQPLTAMMNYVQACRRLLEATGRDTSDKIYDYMEKAVQQAGHAGQIIRRLREFVRKGETDRSLEDISDVVKEASALALVGAAESSIAVELDLAAQLPSVLIDKIQIQQVIFNLVRNSVEALAGSDQRKITIRTSLAGRDTIEVVVGDTGPGLPTEVSDRLFQPFVTTKAHGMGIGLSICNSIIESHDGRLWTTPNPAGGTRFHFTIPAVSSDESKAD